MNKCANGCVDRERKGILSMQLEAGDLGQPVLMVFVRRRERRPFLQGVARQGSH